MEPARLHAVPDDGGDILEYMSAWTDNHLRIVARPSVRKEYPRHVQRFDGFMRDRGRSRFVAETERADIEAWRDHFMNGTKAGGEPYAPSSVRIYTAAIVSFYRWLHEDLEVIDANPADGIKLPTVTARVMDIPTRETIEAVLATTKANTRHGGHRARGYCWECFKNKRDRALFDFLIDTGTRESGVAELLTENVNLTHPDGAHAIVVLKGGNEHRAELSEEAVKSFLRYRAVRAQHPQASSPRWWLGKKGPLSASGLLQMVKRRAADAGVVLNVHDFRRYANHAMAEAGLSEEYRMTLLGWKDPTMARRYGQQSAGKRAREAFRAAGLRDQG